LSSFFWLLPAKPHIITFSFFVFNGSSLLFYSLFLDSCLQLLVPNFSSLSCLFSLVPTSFSLLLCCLLLVPTSIYLLLSLSCVGPHFFLPLRSIIIISLLLYFFLHCLFFSLVSQFMANWVRVNQHPPLSEAS